MKLSYTAIKKAMEISAASLFSLQVTWIIESYSNNVVALMLWSFLNPPGGRSSLILEFQVLTRSIFFIKSKQRCFRKKNQWVATGF
jgi:hypothetical protein